MLIFLSLLLAVVPVDEAAGILMGEEWMKDAAWLVEFPLSQKQWCIGQRHSSMLLSATAQRVSSYKDNFSSEAGIIGFVEDKNLRTRHYEADLEFHKRLHCRFKCKRWWKGTLSGKYPKYRYGLLKSDTLNALTITIYGFGSIWGSVSKDTKKCFG